MYKKDLPLNDHNRRYAIEPNQTKPNQIICGCLMVLWFYFDGSSHIW